MRITGRVLKAFVSEQSYSKASLSLWPLAWSNLTVFSFVIFNHRDISVVLAFIDSTMQGKVLFFILKDF